MRTPYEPESVQFWQGVLEDASGQSGNGLPGFAGLRYQRGAGLGSFFSGLLRLALPAIRSIGRTVGQQALESGSAIMNDLSKGEDLQQTLKRRGREGAANILETSGSQLRQSGGNGLGQITSSGPRKRQRKAPVYKRKATPRQRNSFTTARRKKPFGTAPASSKRKKQPTRWPY